MVGCAKDLWCGRVFARRDLILLLWDVLRIYGVGGHLLEGIQPFYSNASLLMKLKLNESFGIGVGVRQGCVVSSWPINAYKHG